MVKIGATRMHRIVSTPKAVVAGRPFRVPRVSGVRTQQQRHRLNGRIVRCVTPDAPTGASVDRSNSPSPQHGSGRVIIVGAGAAGLATARGLAKLGMDVHVYDRNAIGPPRTLSSSQLVVLTPGNLLSLQALGVDVHSTRFRDSVLSSSEIRTINCRLPQPEACQLPNCQFYTTYEHLQAVMVDSLQAACPHNITFHPFHTLQEGSVNVDGKTVTFVTPHGPRTERYDLLVGADGILSKVRITMVERDSKSMRPAISYVGPQQYVTVHGLPARVEGWTAEGSRLVTSGMWFQGVPNIATAATQASLPTPLVFLGWPLYGWAGAKYYKIKLTAWQDPGKPGSYAATLSGSDALFEELETALESGKAHLASVIADLFVNQLPRPWVEALADAVEREPEGHSLGGSVLCPKLVSPQLCPALALVGDAAHAVTPRTGQGLSAALDTAAKFVDCLATAPNLRAGLERYNKERVAEVNALVWLDRLSPAFLGEEARIGPLATIVQVAIAARLMLNRLLKSVGLSQYAPFPSYLQAMEQGIRYEEVWKKLRRDAALVTGCLIGALTSLARLAYVLYRDNQYLFA